MDPSSDPHDLPNLDPALFDCPTGARFESAGRSTHPPRFLLLYGSLRERSFSKLLTLEAARLLQAMGAETRIFDPLGMRHASFSQPLQPELMALMSKGYSTASDAKPKEYELINMAPAGSLAASGDDMGRFMIAHLQDGEFNGARILSHADFTNNRFNLYVVAISVGFGMIPLVAPNFFNKLPHALHPLLESGILLAAIVSVLLNAFFNGVGSAESAREGAAASAAAAEHA